MRNSRKWDHRYLEEAKFWAARSKDPSTQVGCVIVDERGFAVGQGYNGFPYGVDDTPERLADRTIRLKLTIHAEQNALQRAGRHAFGGTAYVYPMPPCATCAALLIQAGISRIVTCPPTHEQFDRWQQDFALAAEMYTETNTKFEVLSHRD